MFHNKTFYFIFLNFLLVLIVGVAFYNDHSTASANEILVVNNDRLFNEFKMTIETKRDGSKILKGFNSRIDSLQIRFNLATDENSKNNVYQQILIQKENIQKFDEAFTSQETAKIWGRINGYIKDYSKLRKCNLILGSSTSENVLYYSESKDITTDLLKYINKRYEGFN